MHAPAWLAPPPAHHAATAALLGLYLVLRTRLPPDALAQLPGWERQSGVALAAAAAIKSFAPTPGSASSLSDLARLARIVPLGLLVGLAPAAGAWYAAAAAAAVMLFPAPAPSSPLPDATPAALAAALGEDRRQRGGPRQARVALFCDPGGGARADAAAAAIAALASPACDCVRVDASRWPGAAAALDVRQERDGGAETVAARWVGGELVGAVAGVGGGGLARALGVED